jgi:hypothetical protein
MHEVVYALLFSLVPFTVGYRLGVDQGQRLRRTRQQRWTDLYSVVRRLLV